MDYESAVLCLNRTWAIVALAYHVTEREMESSYAGLPGALLALEQKISECMAIVDECHEKSSRSQRACNLEDLRE